MKFIKNLIKKIAFRYTKLGKPNYPFCIEPIQLTFLINEIERLKDLDGCICEIGVARGMTTRFIAQHIKNQKIENKNQYFAIDTFDSFVENDLIFEVKERGKKLKDLRGFNYNSFNVWKRNFSKFDLILETAFKAAAPFKSVVEDAALAEVFGTLDVFVEEICTLS